MEYYNSCLNKWTSSFKNKHVWEKLLNDWNDYIQGSTHHKHLKHTQEQEITINGTTVVVARGAPKYNFDSDGKEEDQLRVSTYVIDHFDDQNF